MRHPLRLTALSFLVDAAFVVIFAAIGRASHQEAVLSGLLVTAWPFLVALAAGWLIVQGWRAPLAPARTGLPLWAITVAGGMLLRAVSGAGVVVAFVIVASVVLLLFLVGWRVVVRLVVRRRETARAA